MNNIKATVLYNIIATLYPKYIRPALVKAIDDPEQDWDDLLLSIVDRIFLYGGD